MDSRAANMAARQGNRNPGAKKARVVRELAPSSERVQEKALQTGAGLCFAFIVADDRKILIVEDDALIALELGERLGDMGYAVLGPALSLEEAERVVADEAPAAALLDANVAGRSSVELGVLLAERGVPVAFCTGYDRIANLPPKLATAPVLTKPITDADLSACLKKLLL